jgi:hypothetical protein
MIYKDFEDYLQTKHAEQYTGLDDEMPDDYEDWLSNLDQEELIRYANIYASKYALEKMEEVTQKIIDAIGYKKE